MKVVGFGTDALDSLAVPPQRPLFALDDGVAVPDRLLAHAGRFEYRGEQHA